MGNSAKPKLSLTGTVLATDPTLRVTELVIQGKLGSREVEFAMVRGDFEEPPTSFELAAQLALMRRPNVNLCITWFSCKTPTTLELLARMFTDGKWDSLLILCPTMLATEQFSPLTEGLPQTHVSPVKPCAPSNVTVIIGSSDHMCKERQELYGK